MSPFIEKSTAAAGPTKVRHSPESMELAHFLMKVDRITLHRALTLKTK